MKEPIKIQLGLVLIELWLDQRHCRTTFPDGKMLGASPQDTEEYLQQARDLGYSDPWCMCWQHEILHTMYMQELGCPYSLSLYRAAIERPFEPHHYSEEAEVLMLQKWLKTGDDSVLKYPCKLEYPIEFRAKVMRVFEQVMLTPEEEYNSHDNYLPEALNRKSA